MGLEKNQGLEPPTVTAEASQTAPEVRRRTAQNSDTAPRKRLITTIWTSGGISGKLCSIKHQPRIITTIPCAAITAQTAPARRTK